MPFVPEKPPVYGETLDSLTARLKDAGQGAYRAKQILKWLYKKRVCDPAQMTDLPESLRKWLADTFDFCPSTLLGNARSSDVTDKLLLKMRDESLVETVLIRAPQEGEARGRIRSTVCVSTQVGCAFGCKFCASGLSGWRRDLSAGEIVSEMMHACRLEDMRLPERAATGFASFDNLVVMGMGEPLSNYDNVIKALTILNAPWGLEVGARRITLSTSGVVPGILRLAKEPAGFRLAVSLHGATNEVRSQIMPVNRKYPLEQLLPAIKSFSEDHGRMVTLEFILIRDVNYTPEQARALAQIARDLHAHVNLIPYNTVEGLPWRRSPLANRQRFAAILKAAGVSATLRREKGHDIDAACGQLRLKTERALGRL